MSALSSISITLRSTSAVFHLSSPRVTSSKVFYPQRINLRIRGVGRVVAAAGQDNQWDELIRKHKKSTEEAGELLESYNITMCDKVDMEKKLEIIKKLEKELIEKLNAKILEGEKSMEEAGELLGSYNTNMCDKADVEQKLENIKKREKELIKKLNTKNLEVNQLEAKINKIKPGTFKH